MQRIDATWYRKPQGIKTRTSAGGVVLRAAEDGWRVAVAREAGGRLVLPKGQVEGGETFEEAARREVEEEAGLWDLTLVASLGSLSRLSYTRKRWVTTHYFLFTTHQEVGIPADVVRHPHPVAWFSLLQLSELFWPEQRELVASQWPRLVAEAERPAQAVA